MSTPRPARVKRDGLERTAVRLHPDDPADFGEIWIYRFPATGEVAGVGIRACVGDQSWPMLQACTLIDAALAYPERATLLRVLATTITDPTTRAMARAVLAAMAVRGGNDT